MFIDNKDNIISTISIFWYCYLPAWLRLSLPSTTSLALALWPELWWEVSAFVLLFLPAYKCDCILKTQLPSHSVLYISEREFVVILLECSNYCNALQDLDLLASKCSDGLEKLYAFKESHV